jgi:hypothetical protein
MPVAVSLSALGQRRARMDPKALLDVADTWLERIAAATGLAHSTVVAAFTLLLGIGLAHVFSSLTRRLVRRGAGWMHGVYPKGEALPSTERIEDAAGAAVYWLAIVFSVMAATETLGLPVVTTWLSGVASFLPRVAAAVFIVALGTVAARLARHLITRAATTARLPSGERLARLGEIMILIGTALVAVDEIGIEISFLKTTLLIVLGTMLGGAALSFALGGRDLVANILSAYYVHKLYAVGQTVRVGDAEGRILRITEMCVVLECAEGSIAVPARAFSDMRSTLVAKPRSER